MMPIRGACLLTGASGGIGSVIAERLASAGHDLFLTSRSEGPLNDLADSLASSGVKIGTCVTDLSDVGQIDGLIRKANRFGPISILINNAGVYFNGAVVDTDLEIFERVYAVNVRAPFLLCRAFMPEMRRRGEGLVVNIGSSSSYVGSRDHSAYCTAKHGLLGLSRSLHAEMRDDNVRTICLSPGTVKSPMGEQVPGQVYETLIDPEDIAKTVDYLVSMDGNVVTEEIRMSRMFVRVPGAKG